MVRLFSSGSGVLFLSCGSSPDIERHFLPPRDPGTRPNRTTSEHVVYYTHGLFLAQAFTVVRFHLCSSFSFSRPRSFNPATACVNVTLSDDVSDVRSASARDVTYGYAGLRFFLPFRVLFTQRTFYPHMFSLQRVFLQRSKCHGNGATDVMYRN